MAGENYFYRGSNNGLEPDESYARTGYEVPYISLATDPRSANQLKATIDKLHTGAKAVEVSVVQPEIFESIPAQHFKELNRLKKLAGAELTLHAPLVEPTGVTKQGWEPSQRLQAERQMWNAVEKGHEMDPKGNTVITFHASVSLPEPETRVFNEKTEKEEIKDFMVVDERDGHFDRILFRPSAFKKEEAKEFTPEDQIVNLNEEAWSKSLQHLNFNAGNGESLLNEALAVHKLKEEIKKTPDLIRAEEEISPAAILEYYKRYEEGKGSEKEIINDITKSYGKEAAEAAEKFSSAKVHEIERADIYLREAYSDLRNLFDKVHAVAKGDDKAKLDAFRDRIEPKLKEIEKDHSKVSELSGVIREGVHILHGIKAPQLLKPLKEFVIDKASETFANVALKAFDEFKENAPIISIENPPAGTAGINRAEEMNKLIDEARKKFSNKLIEKGMSESEAKFQAEKLIGATWDVGHINMLRKLGYRKKEIIEEAKKIAPKVKHIHLSDNFGFEHTELPMGMADVPSKEILEELSKYNKKMKKVVEAGNWYQFFQTTPMMETLAHFNSPIYAMKNAPYWEMQPPGKGTYFAGYGMFPETHYGAFGAGFAGLPSELGGQMPGKSRLSGAPIE